MRMESVEAEVGRLGILIRIESDEAEVCNLFMRKESEEAEVCRLGILIRIESVDADARSVRVVLSGVANFLF